MFPLAFVAGWLQGHWWGFIRRNYVVWPTFLLMNVFIALKGSHFWFSFIRNLRKKELVVIESKQKLQSFVLPHPYSIFLLLTIYFLRKVSMNYILGFKMFLLCTKYMCLLMWSHSTQNSEHNACLHCYIDIADQFNLAFFFFFALIIMIIISLFQEDNISGTNASLTYGLRLQRQKWHWQLNKHKLFTVCTEQVRSPYTEHAASGLPNPTHLEGQVRFDQAQDQQVVTTRSIRIVTECLLARCRLKCMYMLFTVDFE